MNPVQLPSPPAPAMPIRGITRTLTFRDVPVDMAERLVTYAISDATGIRHQVLALDHPEGTYVVRPRRRSNTPDETLPGGGVRVTMKRVCNGCQEPLGDAFEDELDAAMRGMPLPDVRDECPRCRP